MSDGMWCIHVRMVIPYQEGLVPCPHGLCGCGSTIAGGRCQDSNLKAHFLSNVARSTRPLQMSIQFRMLLYGCCCTQILKKLHNRIECRVLWTTQDN